jgi:sensor histidine kinase YesM
MRRGDPAAAEGFDLHLRGMLPLIALGILFGPSAGMTIADTITGFRSPAIWQFDSPASRVTLTITVIASLLTFFVLSTLERLARARADAEAAMRAAAENKLKLLESQLEPHMLFNTLANLRVLIGIDPPRAQLMLDQLIGFLRATLNASRSGAHPLAAEFDRISDYLSLMAIRMGPRLEFALDLPTDLRNQPVPPLLLQPLVENCIKHGLEPQVAGGRIDITARRTGSMLELTVQDNGAGLGQAGSPGSTRFGLEQVRGRLKALFGDAAALTLELRPGGGTRARIVLPVKTAD